MHRTSSNFLLNSAKQVTEPPATEDVQLVDKVIQLEETLRTFRAEVDMKMKIVEQILTTRNEIFSVQKKLLEREQVLHETVLSHWKNIPELATNGLSLQFSHRDQNYLETDCDDKIKESLLGKRSATARTLARRDRRKRLKAKSKGDGQSDSESDSIYGPEDDQISFENSDPPGDGADFENGPLNSNLERKVFVNYYSEEPAVPGHLVTKAPIWKYYLREEGGKEALCKICDESGGRTILKVQSGTSKLHKHLKLAHSEVAENLFPSTNEQETAVGEKSSGGRQQPSPIWNYFTKLSGEDCSKARCNMCHEVGSTAVFKISDGCTSSLHWHLKKTHKIKPTTNNNEPLPLSSTSTDNV